MDLSDDPILNPLVERGKRNLNHHKDHDVNLAKKAEKARLKTLKERCEEDEEDDIRMYLDR